MHDFYLILDPIYTLPLPEIYSRIEVQENPIKLNLTIRILKYDSLFSDLYFVPFGLDSLDYRDFLKKKILRTGLREQDLEDIFSFKIGENSLYEDKPVDTSNKIYHKGEFIDMSSLDQSQIFQLLNEFTFDQLQKYNNLECVRSLNHLATPTTKLHYPEPFISSPSFIHNDIGFIHVLHYQY